MKKVFKKYMFKIVFPVLLILSCVFIGIIKIDMINTKALSPLGNSSENYKLVSKEFGEDFSNFIKDNSFLKIYKENGKDILIRLGNDDFKISDESILTQKIREIFEKFKF